MAERSRAIPKHSPARGCMTAKPPRGRVMENTERKAQPQLGRQRILTVSTLFRQWGTHRKSECVVPSVRLNGKWLAALGFVPGQKIRVIPNGSTITIRSYLERR